MANAITAEVMVLCTVCGVAKDTAEFHRDSRTSTRLDRRCKSCRAEKSRERYHRDVEVSREYGRQHQRRHRMRTAYGLTEDDWIALLQKQGGRCGMCGHLPSDARALVVDHDHGTGAVRELLCNNCNVIIGMAGDDVERLQKAIAYLVKHSPAPSLTVKEQ